MNIIIVGYGKIGQKLTERLSQDQSFNVTVIDTDDLVIKDAVNLYDVMGVIGSGADIATLEEAGVKEADILIAATGSDELNLLICLIAKKTGNCKTIARVRNPVYSKEINLIKDDLGLAMIINPELNAAMEIARSLRFPSAIQIDTFAKGRIEILKFKIDDDSLLVDMKVSELSSKLNCDVLVCGVERGDEAFIPDGNFVLKSGDFISVLSTLSKSVQFFKRIGVKTNGVKDTIIIGGGTTAYYLAKILIQTGVSVKIIEQNPKRCDELCTLLPQATIICGDATNNRVLMEEGIAFAQSVVALTNIDEENVMLSLFAKSITSAKLVTKINRITYDEVIGNLDLGTIIYPKNITAEYVERFVRAKKNSLESAEIETMHLILDGKAEALEFKIRKNCPILNIPFEKINLKKNVLIACINRSGKFILPRGKDFVMENDSIIIVTTHKGSKDVSDLLE